MYLKKKIKFLLFYYGNYKKILLGKKNEKKIPFILIKEQDNNITAYRIVPIVNHKIDLSYMLDTPYIVSAHSFIRQASGNFHLNLMTSNNFIYT